jgi:iron complex transport system substrate-binding protein
MMIDRGRRVLVMGLLATLACGSDGDRDSASVAGPPGRIASLTILSDDVLWALGPDVRARVVGVSALTDDPRYAAHPGRWPAELPRVGTTAESVLALRPDLAIVASFTAVETRSMLANARVQTLTLSNFTGFDDYRQQVRSIGEALGASDRARALVTEFDARLASLRVNASEHPSIMSFSDGMTAAAGTTFHDASVAAGYANLPATHGLQGHVRVRVEQVVAWDPEYIVTPCGDDCEQARRQLVAQPGLEITRAVRNDHVLTIPSPILLATGPEMLDVVEALARARENG